MMRTSFLLIPALLLVACSKDDDAPLAPQPAPAVCGIDGARLEATFDGGAFCANASLFASQAVSMTINGISQQGATLTLELDSVSVGTHAISEITNSILFTTQLAMAYQSTDATPGTLTITSHDTAAKRIRGSFSATLSNQIGLPSAAIAGNFDLYYVE
ncbi:MAG: hypothetical protein KF905_10175 [Flavobacteriales bacterium]|nr:hypothetical protein [Flavobacteriales bacterium]